MRYHELMYRNLFAFLVAFIFAVPARAGGVAPASARAQAWVAPVAGFFSFRGAENIVNGNLPSLTALSTLDSSARYPFVSTPQVLDLLAKHLDSEVTPPAFSAASLGEQMYFLFAAAIKAQAEAAAIADKFLAAAKVHPLHPSSVDRVSEQVAAAEDVALYLDAPRRAEVARMRSAVASFKSQWRRHVEKFRGELPRKIAAEAFDASNILVKTEHGWVAADESPYPIGGDLSQFYERRLEALRKAPQGLWTVREANLLGETLDRPDIGGEKAWIEPTRRWIGLISSHAHERFAEDQPLMRAREAFQRNARAELPVAARHILTVERYYKNALNSRMPASNRLRILAAIRNGAGGLPSWEQLQEIESSTKRRLRGNFLSAAGTLIAAVLVALILRESWGLLAWPLAAKLAAFLLLWLAPSFVMVRSLWLLTKLEIEGAHAYVAEWLRKTFRSETNGLPF